MIFFKIHHIQELIHTILDKWNEDNIDDFISKAKNRLLENAEMDAISIRQLITNYKKLKELLDSIISG